MVRVTRADEDLLLALLNTTPVVDGDRIDELADPAAGRTWAAAHGGDGTDAEVAALHRARDALQRVVLGDATPQTLAAHIENVALRPRLADGGVRWELEAPPGAMLAARALLAWAELSARAPDRLRPCANPECCRFLIDRSNANTAQWCSMALCGNRFKARRHYRRNRTSGA